MIQEKTENLNNFVKDAARFLYKKKGAKIHSVIEELTNKYHELTEKKYESEEFYNFVELVIDDLTNLNDVIAEEFEI